MKNRSETKEPCSKRYEREILVAAMIIFYVIPYFLLNILTEYREAGELTTEIDRMIPFVPEAVLVYVSYYLFLWLNYFLLKDKNYFRKVIGTLIIASSICYLIFLLMPIQMTRPEVDGGEIAEAITLGLYSIDGKGYNCFPSIHVTMSFLTAAFCWRYNRKYWWAALWAGAIIMSTMLVKQHYVLDVLGGLVLGMVIHKMTKNKIKPSSTGLQPSLFRSPRQKKPISGHAPY
jgi:membrane-associated phospholipid phosphatase